MQRLGGFGLVPEQVDILHAWVVVSELAGVPVSPLRGRREWSHEVRVDELHRPGSRPRALLGVRLLSALRQGTDVTVGYGPGILHAISFLSAK